MVFFTCNTCGESIKRGQVEKHYQQQCRNCDVLSCVDCGKNFRGNEYLQHTKCISEEEKYSGKDYKPKPGANKGEKKQDAWIENVQSAIDNANAHPKVKGILLQIKDYPNIPRKKQKFENFLKNSLRIWDTSLITQAWDRINSEIAKNTETKENEEKNKAANDNTTTKSKEDENSAEATENGTTDKKLSKRERKEERRKQANKKEKKDKSANEEDGEKKTKKRKLEEISENGDAEVSKKKRKKKKKHQDEEEIEEEEIEEAEEEPEDQVEQRPKFKWDSVILEVLQSAKGNEISLKKLQKKVFAEYMATGGDGKCRTEEKIITKFYKKVMKKTYWKIVKDNVKLNPQ